MTLSFRTAKSSDLDALVSLLANDVLGKQREDITEPLNARYVSAFEAIERDPNNQLLVAEKAGRVVGMLQLTYIPYLTHIGSWRCLIEGVRVAENVRGEGVGEALFKYAFGLAADKGCRLVQLTSDKQRPDAIRFYEKLGFTATHEGLKYPLAIEEE
ncbi:GNAT family N-acetyltransferase [Thaumasiovibrio subtropicus]|uniref:GNAT family N-acetyltransferase n=1 Tax=Thaumasiovibrio subtropicus TaxID=1891207 RepID=UPI000B34B042|nr:GNAT family N-acetyltransferase [Thaumasiovibrio subtropicus]